MKKLLVFALLLACLFLYACKNDKYSSDLSCNDITNTLQKRISELNEYTAYSESDIEFILENDDHFDSCSIIYSISGEDIGEVGVLHAKSGSDARKLLEDARNYIEQVCEDKNSFVENYLPKERSKLDCADAKRFGNYVVFAMLESDVRDTVFAEAEKMLK